MQEPRKKIVVVVGPTSSGKSELAVKLAKKLDGEVLSADSRQVYKGLDIGAGKIPGQQKGAYYLYKGIPHYGIDIASPKRQFSAGSFQKYAKKVIDAIHRRGKIPIICGGTGHWIDAVVLEQSIPEVKPNAKLRKALEKLSTEQLFAELGKVDRSRAKTIDKHNRRRLIRALEIITATGKPVPKLKEKTIYGVQWAGIDPGKEVLEKKIKKRLKQRLAQGMVKEVRKLHSPPAGGGLSWKRLENFGLEYKYVAMYLQKKLTYEEMYSQLLTAIIQYSKRQRTWWKRNRAIRWQSSLSGHEGPD